MKKELIAAALCLTPLWVNAQAQWSKLSPLVRQAVMAQSNIVERTDHTPDGSDNAPSRTTRRATLTALVQSSTPQVLTAEGCRILASWGDIHVASIPLSQIASLSCRPEVMRIEAGEPCHLTLDTTALVTRTAEAWQRPRILDATTADGTTDASTYEGQGVVVGVMDAGFDLTHPTYYSRRDGRYRIQAFWDLIEANDDTLALGRTYVGQEQLLAKGHSTDAYLLSHGTHTSGIAAGSGCEQVVSGETTDVQPSEQPNPLYRGMAPEADLCLVANYITSNGELVPPEQRYRYTSATDLLGFRYIFDYAEQQGKPCVINFSEGQVDDAYETTLYQTVFAQMVGPGRILCASAGNEGHKGTYLHKAVGEDEVGAFLIGSNNQGLYQMRSDRQPFAYSLSAYVTRDSTVTLAFVTELDFLYPDSIFNDTLTLGGERYAMAHDSYPSCYDSTQMITQLQLTDLQHERLGYNTRLVLRLLGADRDLECFGASGYFAQSNYDPSLTHFTYDHNILYPGCLPEIITVGNSGYRTSYQDVEGNWQSPYTDKATDGRCALYSSKGPTLQGLIKPDVVAPGMNVISSRNSWYLEQNPKVCLSQDVRHFEHAGRTYGWYADSGTSMSSPVVAGIVALWLQACPTLSPDEVREILAHTCSHYDPSLTYPNNYYGHGGIDAQAGLDYIEQHFVAGIRDVKTSPDRQPRYFTPDGRMVRNPSRYNGLLIKTR